MKPHATLAVVALCAALTSPTRAQQAPVPSDASDPTKPEGQVVKLSTFVVNVTNDRGYAAMSSTGATRADMAIKDIPVTVSVVNRQFLDDSAAFDFMDALAYSPGIISRRDDRTAISVRGFAVGEPFVNNFRRLDHQDTSNIERVEIIRGGAAVLYGITSAGGTVNVITKTPVYGRTFGEAKATFGTYDFRRAEVDYNAPAGQKLAFRVTAAHQYSDGYRSPTVQRPFDVDELNVITPSVAFHPFEGTNITVEYESMSYNKSIPEETLTVPVDGRGVPVPILYDYPIGITFRGPYSVDNVDYHALTAILDQKITEDLSLRLSAYQVDYNWPRGGLVGFSFLQGNGQHWPDPVTGAPSWRGFFQESEEQWNMIYSYRADAVYKFDLGKNPQQLLVGGQYYEDTNLAKNKRDFVAGTRTTHYRYYPVSDKNVVPLLPSDLNYQSLNSGTRVRNENSQVYVVHTGKWFDEKLVTLLGFFQIKFDNIQHPSRPADDGRDPSLHAHGPASGYKNDSTAPQAGVLYKPNEQYSLYALYSESVNSIATDRTDQFGNPLNPVFATNYEAGVKLDLSKQLIGTVGVYNAEIQNSVAFNENLPNPSNPTADPGISPRGAWEQVGKQLISGLVADLVWAPTRQFEARLGWQHVFRNEITEDTNQALIGRMHGRHIEDFVTFFGRYTFDPSGRFAGLSANLGVEWRGKQLREYPAFNAPEPTYYDGFWNVDGAIRYTKRIGGRNYTFALNIKNLFEREVPIGYQIASTEAYYFSTDREFYLTMGVRF